MKFKLTLTREYIIDTNTDWTSTDDLLDVINENRDAEEGRIDSIDEASPDELHDGIRTLLDNDVTDVLDPEVDGSDFTIEILGGEDAANNIAPGGA